LSKHQVTLVHHLKSGEVRTHHLTYDARNPLHALDKLREEISRDEVMIEEIQHAQSTHTHVHPSE